MSYFSLLEFSRFSLLYDWSSCSVIFTGEYCENFSLAYSLGIKGDLAINISAGEFGAPTTLVASVLLLGYESTVRTILLILMEGIIYASNAA